MVPRRSHADAMIRYRPLRRVVVERLLLCLLFAFCASTWLGMWLSPLTVPFVVAVWLWSSFRHARLTVEVDEQGLRVRNPWRSYVVKWSEVANVSPIVTESKTPYLVPGLRRSGFLTAIRLWALAVPTERVFSKHTKLTVESIWPPSSRNGSRITESESKISLSADVRRTDLLLRPGLSAERVCGVRLGHTVVTVTKGTSHPRRAQWWVRHLHH